MSRSRYGLMLGVLGALLLVPGLAAQQPEAMEIAAEAQALEGDRELLHQTMVDSRIATGRSRPGLSLWAQDAGLAFSHWMGRWMDRVLPGLNRWLVPLIEPATKFLLALLATLLLVFGVRFVLDRWRRRLPTKEPVQHLGARPEQAVAHDWENELRRHLERGDVAAATHALWWWLAGRLAAERAEPSWTSRELVRSVGRGDLLVDVRRLDRMIYGATRPSAGDVRRLWGDLQEAVG